MSRGCSLFVCSLSILVLLLTGCPQPTPPAANGPVANSGKQPSAEPQEPLPPDDAEAVKKLRDGGHSLKVENDRVVEVELVPTGDDQLLEIVAKLPNVRKLMAGGPNVTNAGLEKIKDMKSLRVLDLDQAGVDDAGMEHLVGLPLVDINLKLTNVRDDGVKHLAKISTLKQLKLIKTNVTNEGIAHVKTMQNLQGIDLQDVVTVDHDILPILKDLPNLRFLRIYSQGFNGDGIAPIAEMKNLRVLSMEQTKLDDKNVHYLKGLTELEKLAISGTFVSDEGMAQLTGLTKLKELDLRDTGCGGGGMPYLTSMSSLKVLELSNLAPNEQSMENVGKLTGLEDLTLWQCNTVNDAAVAKLEKLANLKRLNLDKTAITDAALDTVAKFKSLEFLHFGNTSLSDAGLKKLHELKNLKKIHVTFTQVTDEGIGKLQEAIPALKADGAIVR